MSRIKLNVCKKLGYLFQGGLEAFLLEVDISLAYAACSLHLLNLVLLFGCFWNQVEKHLVGLSEIIASFLKALVRFGAIFFHLFKRLTSLVHHFSNLCKFFIVRLSVQIDLFGVVFRAPLKLSHELLLLLFKVSLLSFFDRVFNIHFCRNSFPPFALRLDCLAFDHI